MLARSRIQMYRVLLMLLLRKRDEKCVSSERGEFKLYNQALIAC